MATVTKTIGTASRDYSTITLWEADLDNFSTVYASGDDAVGECYNDSDFNEVVNINGGGTSITGLNSIKLTVAETDRHDGTAGTGARMVYNSQIQMYSDKNIELCWLEIDWGGTFSNQFSVIYTQNNSYQQKIANMLIHDAQTDSTGRMIFGKYGYLTIANNIVYNLTHTGVYRGYGIYVESYRPSYAYNNTVHNIASTHPNAAYTFGIHIPNSNNVRNNIVTEVGDGTYSGCFGNVTAGTNSNNMSTDDTAPGSNSLTDVTASAQFVSVVAGAEDLHLATDSEAIGAGANLGSAGDIVQFDIDGVYRGTVWDIGADQTPATVTKTIGTSSRDYSTITSWEAELDTQGVYANGDSAVGECYNDAAFDEDFIMNGGATVGLNSVKLSVASGERHDGTEGSGARIVVSSSPTYAVIDLRVPAGFNQKYTIEWIELDVNGQSALPLNNDSSANQNVGIVKNVIIHGANGGQAYNGIVKADSRSITLLNSIFYDHTRDSGLYCRGITVNMDRTEALIANCTIYGVSNPNTTAPAYGIIAGGGDSGKIKNNIVMNITTGGTGENPCFSGTALTGGKADYNMSDDDTADDLGGGNNLINKSVSNQFISILSGSEDLHLSGSSDAIDAGTDLTGTVDGVEYDIDGQLRAGLWDIGADELLGGHIRRLLLGIG